MMPLTPHLRAPKGRHSRPEVLHGVKLGDELQVVLPGPASVVLEEPQNPPGE